MHSNSFSGLHLHGFLGLNELDPILSSFLIALGMLTIINSYNLIDGIDGLAAIIAIIIFVSFGMIFFITGGFWFYILICIAFTGMLFAFLRYNFSNKSKIFMGDTGSLIIGFCIAVCSVRLLTMQPVYLSKLSILPENIFFLILAILWIPLFDMIRVVCIRLKNKQSPFYPDRNHLHHVLIDRGLRHHQVAIIIGIINYLIIILIGISSIYLNYLQMLVLVIILFLISMVIGNQLNKKK